MLPLGTFGEPRTHVDSMHNASVDHLKFTFFVFFFDAKNMGAVTFDTKCNAGSSYLAHHSALLFPPDLAKKRKIDA